MGIHLPTALLGLPETHAELPHRASLLFSAAAAAALLILYHLIVVKCTQHKIYHFKLYASVVLRTFTVLCNHHLCLVPGRFSSPQSETLYP